MKVPNFNMDSEMETEPEGIKQELMKEEEMNSTDFVTPKKEQRWSSSLTSSYERALF